MARGGRISESIRNRRATPPPANFNATLRAAAIRQIHTRRCTRSPSSNTRHLEHSLKKVAQANHRRSVGAPRIAIAKGSGSLNSACGQRSRAFPADREQLSVIRAYYRWLVPRNLLTDVPTCGQSHTLALFSLSRPIFRPRWRRRSKTDRRRHIVRVFAPRTSSLLRNSYSDWFRSRDQELVHRLICSWHLVAFKMGRRQRREEGAYLNR
jgi:hypothetical protein